MQGKFTSVNLLLKRKFPKNPRVSQCAQGTEGGEFFCSSVFLQASHSGKMVKTKKDNNRKEITESAAEQLGINSTSKGLDDRVDRFVDIGFIGVSVNIPVISLSSFLIFTEPFFSLYSFHFFPPCTIALASLFICVSNFRFFTH